MADEEVSSEIFDPSLMKKKKKKKGFNLDAAMSEGVTEVSEPAPENGEAEDRENKEDTPDMDDIFGKKNKKKKKKAFNFDEMNDALPDTSAPMGDNEEANGDAGNEMDDLDMTMDFGVAKKKKKAKKKKHDLEDLINVDMDQDDKNKENEAGQDWAGSDRDYSYDELLARAFTQLREKNPEMATGEKKKFVMKPPQVVRIGSKKTAFANFSEICRLLHRMPKHVLQFLLAELGTSGSIDGNNQLIIKGRFQQKQIENVLRRYIKEYVTCHTCRSPDTILQKDARLYFLQCEQCNSRCSVAIIKSGFQAVANKAQRQAIRASKN
ncbi:unnamed protein product [Meganyctiphanes norvegica]|uniref:Eukaryotic translation initiation factor 2 subunit 2 n=1 Tax=Meganyctiphanes norvegica TaxID=48144 RepID=A0AAV2PZH9_MEGNR